MEPSDRHARSTFTSIATSKLARSWALLTAAAFASAPTVGSSSCVGNAFAAGGKKPAPSASTSSSAPSSGRRGKGKKTAIEGTAGSDDASSTRKPKAKKKPVVEDDKPKGTEPSTEVEEEDPMPHGKAKRSGSASEPVDPMDEEEAEQEDTSKPKKQVKTRSDIFSRVSMELATYGDSDHVFVASPTVALSLERPTEGWSLSGRYLVDMVSAASVDIVSTATQHWTEIRQAGSLNGQYKPHDFGITASGSISREPDYLSLSGGAALLFDFNGKNDTLTLGYGYGRDTVGRHFTSFDVFSGVLQHNAVTAGLGFVIDRATVGSIALDGVFESGDESKPYRYVPVFSATVAPQIQPGMSISTINQLARLPERPAEQLPTERKRYAATLRLAHRYDSSTLRFEERIYDDDWGIKASTTDVRYMIDLSRRVTFWPHFRAHIQSGASFWQLAYVSNRAPGSINDPNAWSVPAIRTGDRELSQLWTGTTGLGIQWAIGASEHPSAWVLSMNGDLMYTSYADALYILSRTGGFFSLGLEAEL